MVGFLLRSLEAECTFMNMFICYFLIYTLKMPLLSASYQNCHQNPIDKAAIQSVLSSKHAQ